MYTGNSQTLKLTLADHTKIWCDPGIKSETLSTPVAYAAPPRQSTQFTSTF